MENQKSNKVLVVLLILFIIITILLGCYIIFSKNSTNKTVNNSQKNDGTSDNVSNVVNSEYNYNLTKRTTTQAVKESTYKMKVTVDTEGNVYLDCNDSVINDVKNENIKKNLTNLRSKYDVYFPEDHPEYDRSNNAYKLDIDKVMTAYYIELGNFGYGYFVFVKENGTISYISILSILENGEINVKDVDTIKNVVSIVNNDYGNQSYAIILDGTEVSLYDYIK
ncbi:MAG: hypothetical protein SOZ11_04460 [Bacilli bacterium]|nr:hypothetical protein [Bacilli bacterium]